MRQFLMEKVKTFSALAQPYPADARHDPKYLRDFYVPGHHAAPEVTTAAQPTAEDSASSLTENA